MSSIAAEIELLPQIVSDTRTTNYLTLAAFVVFLYDMILTFPSELDLVWKARWTTGKVLFILNRYPVFLVSVFLLAYMFDYYSAFDFCVVSNYVEAWSMLVFVIPVQVILILRTAALWEQKRKVLIFLLAALLATDGTIIASISLITKSLSFEDRPATKQILGCYGSLNEVSTSNAIPSWVALMLFDTLVFVLTLVRVEGIRRAKKDQSLLLHILFRDGIAFYLVMLASSIANLALYAGLPFRRRGLIISLIPLLRTVMSVCTARLLLNLRAAAVANGRASGHWAFGELNINSAAHSLSSMHFFVASASGLSSEGGRFSVAPRAPTRPGSRYPSNSTVSSLNSYPYLATPDPSRSRSQIHISVSRTEEVYIDSGDSSSFRTAVLGRFANISGSNTSVGFEFGELPRRAAQW